MPDFSLERLAGGVVAGIDEAGRGPWAGPVVAAAVVLDAGSLPPDLNGCIDDSKKLSPARRSELFERLCACARIGIGRAEVDEIDIVNILGATHVAMARAVEALGMLPEVALVDGNQAPKLACRIQCVVGGDGLSLSIAAASIVAKVTRDRIMADLAKTFPGYGWERNVGYGTAEHRSALERLGVTPHHRRGFRPIAHILSHGRA
jgi:ribonuclease HII